MAFGLLAICGSQSLASQGLHKGEFRKFWVEV